MTKNIKAPGFVLPGIEDVSRRDFLVGGAATLLLAGCGSNGGGNNEASGETRTVEDGRGRSVEVPADPQRVVVIDPNRVLFHLVELGLVPVGATTNPTTVGGDFPPLLGQEREGIEPVGGVLSPSLERIAALEPDLIFYAFAYDTLSLDDLSEITPTIAYDASALDFDIEKSLRFVAKVVNRQEEAEHLISDFDSKFQEAASDLDLGGRAFSVVEVRTDSIFYLMGPEVQVGRMVERLGGEIVPKEVDGELLEGLSAELSLERAPDFVKADTVLLMRFFDGGELQEGFEAFANSPVWQNVPAVERGDVISLDSHAAYGSYGFIGLEKTLSRLIEELS